MVNMSHDSSLKIKTLRQRWFTQEVTSSKAMVYDFDLVLNLKMNNADNANEKDPYK